MQTVFSGGERLAFHGHRIGKFDDRVFISSGAPGLSVGNDAAPDLATRDQRTMIGNGDVGDADPLRDPGALAGAGQIKQGRLGLRTGYAGEQRCEYQYGKKKMSLHETSLLKVVVVLWPNRTNGS